MVINEYISLVNICITFNCNSEIAQQLKVRYYEDWYKISLYSLVPLEIYQILPHQTEIIFQAEVVPLFPNTKTHCTKLFVLYILNLNGIGTNWMDIITFLVNTGRTLKIIVLILNPLLINFVSTAFSLILHREIKEPFDWNYVSIRQVHQHGGGGLLNKYYGGSLQRALQTLYPEHNWQRYRLTKPPHIPAGATSFSKQQYFLLQLLQTVSNIGVLGKKKVIVRILEFLEISRNSNMRTITFFLLLQLHVVAYYELLPGTEMLFNHKYLVTHEQVLSGRRGNFLQFDVRVSTGSVIR